MQLELSVELAARDAKPSALQVGIQQLGAVVETTTTETQTMLELILSRVSLSVLG